MFNRLLILSASAGAGHIRAAQAIERAIKDANAAREVRHVDTLEYTNKLFKHLYSKAYIDMVNKTPELLGWLYDKLDKPWQGERQRLMWSKLNTRPFVKLLHDYQPDMIVCTHFLPAEIISWLKAKEKLDTKQAIVVTDMDVHAMWLCRHFEHYFVALDETKVHLSKLGIPAEKITVSGIPIDPSFAQTKDKAGMRRKHGLEADRTTILVSAGGFGVGPIEHLVQSLLALRHRAQVVAICGKSKELKARLEKIAAKADAQGSVPGPQGNVPDAQRNVQLHVIGFTTEMDEYMSAADLIVGKPGGLTTSEAMAKGLVFVIVNPIPGQEERNSDHLLEQGIAIRCNNLPTLAYKIDALLEDPPRFARMQANARAFGRPHAARDIVARLLELHA